MPLDEIDVTILDDGRIRTENGKISNPNHSNASELFRYLAEVTGGKTERTKRKQTTPHVHTKLEQEG